MAFAFIAALGVGSSPAHATTQEVNFIGSTYKVTPGGNYGGGNAQYTTSHFPIVSIEVESDIELIQCVFVAYKNSDGRSANLSSEPILLSEGRYKCQIDMHDLDYEINSEGHWTVTPLVYDINWERHDSPTSHGFIADFDPPASKITNAEKYVNANSVHVVIYFSVDDGNGTGFKTLEFMYSKDGGPWKQASETCDTQGNTTIPCDFFPSRNGGNGTYRIYTLATDYVGHTETKTPVAEATIVVTELDDPTPVDPIDPTPSNDSNENSPGSDEGSSSRADPDQSFEDTIEQATNNTESFASDPQEEYQPGKGKTITLTNQKNNLGDIALTTGIGSLFTISALGVFAYTYMPAFSSSIKKLPKLLAKK